MDNKKKNLKTQEEENANVKEENTNVKEEKSVQNDIQN